MASYTELHWQAKGNLFSSEINLNKRVTAIQLVKLVVPAHLDRVRLDSRGIRLEARTDAAVAVTQDEVRLRPGFYSPSDLIATLNSPADAQQYGNSRSSELSFSLRNGAELWLTNISTGTVFLRTKLGHSNPLYVGVENLLGRRAKGFFRTALLEDAITADLLPGDSILLNEDLGPGIQVGYGCNQVLINAGAESLNFPWRQSSLGEAANWVADSSNPGAISASISEGLQQLQLSGQDCALSTAWPSCQPTIVKQLGFREYSSVEVNPSIGPPAARQETIDLAGLSLKLTLSIDKGNPAVVWRQFASGKTDNPVVPISLSQAPQRLAIYASYMDGPILPRDDFTGVLRLYHQ